MSTRCGHCHQRPKDGLVPHCRCSDTGFRCTEARVYAAPPRVKFCERSRQTGRVRGGLIPAIANHHWLHVKIRSAIDRPEPILLNVAPALICAIAPKAGIIVLGIITRACNQQKGRVDTLL